MWNDIIFCFSEAFIGIRRAFIMIFLSIATITSSMVILGFFLLIMLNINYLSDFIVSKFEIRAYLQPNLTKTEILEYQSRLKKMKYVKNTEFIDKDIAWNKFKSNFPNLDFNVLHKENPLPHSIKIYALNSNKINVIANYLKASRYYIEDVAYGGKLSERISIFSKVLRNGGIVLVGILILATFFIVVNTIRLTVIARQEEISITRLVGATSLFIRFPFIIEGLIIGFIGSFLSVFFLKSSYDFLLSWCQENLSYFPMVYEPYILAKVYGSVLILGLILGFFGANFSVSKALKGIH